MNYAIIKKLPSMDELSEKIPLSNDGYQRIRQDREEVKAILRGEDPRWLIIVGPCSAWPKSAVLHYAEKLAQLNNEVCDKLKIVMRVYIQKPRTAKGWTGPVNQPDPLSYPDIGAGMQYTRDMMIKVLQMGLPIADEALFTHNATGFIELLSWVAIGARSSEDQEHRIFASALDCAVGMKNPTHGHLQIGINSIIAAQNPHVAVFDGFEVQTHGNPYAHLVLRGCNNQPNYSLSHLKEIHQLMQKNLVKNPAVMIDASHDNCLIDGKKDYRRQPQVIAETLQNLQSHAELRSLVKGFMLESFLQEGNQKIESKSIGDLDLNGLSITDPCLSWEQTRVALLELAQCS